MSIAAEQLMGTWKLVEASALDADGGLLSPPYGPEPMGRLVLTGAGRMMAVLCDGRTEMPAGQKRAYASYCGNFRIEDDRLITTVDAALIADRIGGEQIRRFILDGERLTLMPPRRADGAQRFLVWERESAG
ncbi:lipocalin-like domain-containing protein [Sphingobium sp.]|uniref:lipocalin-like domain-containing protein n=1 Tax=Sphingobium sp. TaxID=1912891 RepID=UPI00262707D8|nr:lipocalin-like domain-containing protein [Sphingobium sp.]